MHIELLTLICNILFPLLAKSTKAYFSKESTFWLVSFKQLLQISSKLGAIAHKNVEREVLKFFSLCIYIYISCHRYIIHMYICICFCFISTKRWHFFQLHPPRTPPNPFTARTSAVASWNSDAPWRRRWIVWSGTPRKRPSRKRGMFECQKKSMG